MKFRIASIFAVISILLLFCSCGYKDRIDIVLDWTPNTNHTGLYVAQENGYFDEEGITVNIVQPPEDSSTLLVGSGAAEFGISSQDSLAMALSSRYNVPVTAVAAILQHNTSGIMSLERSGISSPKDMQAKTYATWNSPVEQKMVRHIVEIDGGDFSKVNVVPVASSDVLSLLTDRIDMIYAYYGWDGIAARESGIETRFLSMREFAPYLDFYAPLIVANTTYLERHKETARKFMRSVCRGYKYSIENPLESAEILLKANPQLDRKITIASQVWISEQYNPNEGCWGKIETQRWSNFYAWLYQNKLIPNRIPDDKGFSNEYLVGVDNEN